MWKKLSSRVVLKHPRMTLVEDEVLLPNGEKTKYIKHLDSGALGVTVIAKREDGRILVQKEYSYPPNAVLYQFPGGGVPAGEKPEDGANRELMEESSLRADRLELVGEHLHDNRRSASKAYVYLATDLKEDSLPSDPEEEIEDFWLTEEEIDHLVANGEILNAYMLAAWALYKSRES